tara:strand:- start:215 stop:433 length:219 start_codon:yes stop_codon:yes gene_type:complete
MNIGTLVSAEEGNVVGIIVPKPSKARTVLYDDTAVWVMVLHLRGQFVENPGQYIGHTFAWGPKQLEVINESR